MIKLKGTIVSGIGVGQRFVSLEGYMKQFKRKLGLKPFKGTLNIELDEESAYRFRSLIDREDPIELEPFEEGGKEYGEVKVFRSEIQGILCFLVVPEKSIHRGVAEVISEFRLRDKLELNQGDEVVLKVFQNSSST